MCIICYTPAGVALPDKNTFKTMFNNNPDGGGLMYTDGGGVVIDKGFFDVNAMYNAARAARAKYPTTPVVLHFRISTQGGASAPLTHPYPVCGDYKRMRQLRTRAPLAIAHNGVINEYAAPWSARSKLNYNDTMTFTKDFVAPLLRGRVKWYTAPDADALRVALRAVSASRLAIMSANGHVELIGHFYADNGLYYSNESYKPPRPYVYGGTGWTYATGKGWTQHAPTAWGTCAGDCTTCHNYDCIEWDGKDSPIYAPAQYPDIEDGNDGKGGNNGE